MTAYATADQVKLAVARDPDKPVGSAATLGFDQLDLAIADAQAEVDGRLRSQYTVPFTDPVPAMIQAITIDIAAYLASLTFYQEKDMKDTDPVVRRYKRACCMLTDIASGSIDLDGGDGGQASPRTGGGFMTPIPPSGGSLFGMRNFGLSRFGRW